MSGPVVAMRTPDVMRRLLLTVAPWWNERSERERAAKVRRAHRRAIRVRIAAEHVAARYERQDAVFRRR